MTATAIVLTHALNDIDAALADALAARGITVSQETARRILDDVLCDDRFTHRMTSVVHDTVGSPFDAGDYGAQTCDDRALAIVRRLIWR